jgi:hypothetical protein
LLSVVPELEAIIQYRPEETRAPIVKSKRLVE